MKKSEKVISKKTIERMSKYLRYLTNLQSEGQESIDSKKLADLALISPTTLRKDLSMFGGFGKTGYGYDIKNLKTEIENILNINGKKKYIIVGAGNIGSALANYRNFEKVNFYLSAVFDTDKNKIGKTLRGVKITDVKKLNTYLSNNKDVEIAILCTPMGKTKDNYQLILKHKVPAIWNFAPCDLKSSEYTTVINEHLTKNLLVLNYLIKEKK